MKKTNYKSVKDTEDFALALKRKLDNQQDLVALGMLVHAFAELASEQIEGFDHNDFVSLVMTGKPFEPHLTVVDAKETPDSVTVAIDAHCKHCHTNQYEVVAVQENDERTWTCPDCGKENTLYYDDDPYSRGVEGMNKYAPKKPTITFVRYEHFAYTGQK